MRTRKILSTKLSSSLDRVIPLARLKLPRLKLPRYARRLAMLLLLGMTFMTGSGYVSYAVQEEISATPVAPTPVSATPVSATPVSATPVPPENAQIGYADIAPNINGSPFDVMWDDAIRYPINQGLLGTEPDGIVQWPSWMGLYDDDYLYLYVEVPEDSDWITDSGDEYWQDDAIEIYLDGNHSRNTSYDGVDDRQLTFRPSDSTIHTSTASAPLPAGIEFSMISRSNFHFSLNGYTLEVKLPLADIGLSSVEGAGLGIDIQVIDDDDGGDRDYKWAWQATVDETYLNPSLMGTARLGGSSLPTPTPTSVTPTETPPPPGDAQINGVTQPIYTDGEVDELWDTAIRYPINHTVLGEGSPSTADLSATWRGLYDDISIHLLIEVTDDSLINDWGDDYWMDDAVEIYLDGNHSRGSTYDGVDDRQFVIRIDDPQLYMSSASAPSPLPGSGVSYRMSFDQKGYRLEVRILQYMFDVAQLAEGFEFGIDIHVIDDDDGGSREHKLAWHSTVDETYLNPSLMGTARLGSGGPATPVVPTETPTAEPGAPSATPTATLIETPTPTLIAMPTETTVAPTVSRTVEATVVATVVATATMAGTPTVVPTGISTEIPILTPMDTATDTPTDAPIAAPTTIPTETETPQPPSAAQVTEIYLPVFNNQQ